MTIQSIYPTFVGIATQKPVAPEQKSLAQQEVSLEPQDLRFSARKKRKLLDGFEAGLLAVPLSMGAWGVLNQPEVNDTCSIQKTQAQAQECGKAQGENDLRKAYGTGGLIIGGGLIGTRAALNKLDDINQTLNNLGDNLERRMEKRRAKKLAEKQKKEDLKQL